MKIRVNFNDYGHYINWKKVVYMMDTVDDSGKKVLRIAYHIAGAPPSDEPPYRELDYARDTIREVQVIFEEGEFDPEETL